MADSDYRLDEQDMLNQIADEEASKAALAESGLGAAPEAAATMVTPDQAALYKDVDFMGGSQDKTKEQQFVEALQMWQQPRPPQAPLAPTGSFSQDEIGRHMQAAQAAKPPEMNTQGSNLIMAQQAPEAFNVMQGAQAGLPLQTNMPVPLRPAVPPTAAESVQQEEQQLQLAEQEAAQRQLAAETAQAKARHSANIETAADDKVAEQDAAAASKSGTDWGKIVGQAVAVGLGEYGRHLTGGTENLAAKTIERVTAEQARKEKLSMEQLLAMQKKAYQDTQTRLKEEALKTDSELKKAQLAKIRMETKAAENAVATKQKVMARLTSGQGFSSEELQVLPDKDRARSVLMPDGTYKLAVSAQRAKEATEVADAAANATRDLHKLQEMAEYFGNNPGKKLLNREMIAQAQALQQAIKGNLRLPILGPGAMTDNEQRLLNNVVRDPSSLFSLGGANKAALNMLVQKLNEGRRQTYRSAGINVPPSKNDLNIAKLKAARPGMTDRQAADVLMASGNWVDEN